MHPGPRGASQLLRKAPSLVQVLAPSIPREQPSKGEPVCHARKPFPSLPGPWHQARTKSFHDGPGFALPPMNHVPSSIFTVTGGGQSEAGSSADGVYLSYRPTEPSNPRQHEDPSESKGSGEKGLLCLQRVDPYLSNSPCPSPHDPYPGLKVSVYLSGTQLKGSGITWPASSSSWRIRSKQ